MGKEMSFAPAELYVLAGASWSYGYIWIAKP